MTFHARLTGQLTLWNIPDALRLRLRQRLTIPNPVWEVLKRRGDTRALYATPRNFKYYREDGGSFTCGRGVLAEVEALAKANGWKIDFQEFQVEGPMPTLVAKPGFALREYQRLALSRLVPNVPERGVLHLGTGWGKSIAALFLSSLLQRRTCILVPRISIAQQFANEAARWFEGTVAVVGGEAQGDPETASVVIALPQTLIYHEGLAARLAKSCGLLIVDECDRFITEQRLALIAKFAARYRYGMTATPRRTDGQGAAIGFTFGPIIMEGEMERVPPTVIAVESSAAIADSWEYHEIAGSLAGSDERNQLIASFARHEAENGRKVLVLTKRIAHYQEIAKLLMDIDINQINSRGKAKEKAEMLRRLRENPDFQVVLGTYSMLSTGVDIPALDTLIFAGDLKSDVLTEQSAGRILRLFQGKPNPIIYDFHDRQPILRRQWQLRQRFYRSQGWALHRAGLPGGLPGVGTGQLPAESGVRAEAGAAR